MRLAACGIRWRPAALSRCRGRKPLVASRKPNECAMLRVVRPALMEKQQASRVEGPTPGHGHRVGPPPSLAVFRPPPPAFPPYSPAAAAARSASGTPTTTLAIACPSMAVAYRYSMLMPASAISRATPSSEPGSLGAVV